MVFMQHCFGQTGQEVINDRFFMGQTLQGCSTTVPIFLMIDDAEVFLMAEPNLIFNGRS